MLLDIISLISLTWFSLFQTVKLPDQTTMSVKGSYQTEDIIIDYGQLYYDDGDIDAILIVKDITSMTIQGIWIYDQLGIESFDYVADVGDNQIIIVCDRYHPSSRYDIPLYQDTILILYSLDGLVLDTRVLSYRPKSYYNHHYHLAIETTDGQVVYTDKSLSFNHQLSLKTSYVVGHAIIQYQGQAIVNGVATDILDFDWPGYYDIEIVDNDYRYAYTIAVHPHLIYEGTKKNDVFTDEVSIHAAGTLQLNDDDYISGTLITMPGIYRLTILGENGYVYTEDFTLMPTITYHDGMDTAVLDEGMQFTSSIQIYANGTSMTLNEENYLSEQITETGHYELRVEGVNQMAVTMTFDILPHVKGIEDGGVYESISIYVFGEAIINDDIVSGVYETKTPGAYVLTLMFEDQVYQVIEFEIESQPETLQKDLLEQPWVSGFFALVIIAGIVLILRKK